MTKQVLLDEWSHKQMFNIAIHLYKAGIIQNMTRKNAANYLVAWYCETQGVGDIAGAQAKLNTIKGAAPNGD